MEPVKKKKVCSKTFHAKVLVNLNFITQIKEKELIKKFKYARRNRNFVSNDIFIYRLFCLSNCLSVAKIDIIFFDVHFVTAPIT